MSKIPHDIYNRVVYAKHLPEEVRHNDDILRAYETKDGLIRAVDLETEIFFYKAAYTLRRVYKLKGSNNNILLYPRPEIRGVLNYIFDAEPNLWPMSAIKLSTNYRGGKGAPVYGVNFSRAVAIAIKNGFIKSRFQIDLPERFERMGFLTDFLIHLSRNKQPDGGIVLELQTWQGIQQSSQVFYIHGIMAEDGSSFSHLDGALIEFDEDSLTALFENGRKLKGRVYEKLFRLDGEIIAKSAFNIIRQFLLVTELTDEFFSASELT